MSFLECCLLSYARSWAPRGERRPKPCCGCAWSTSLNPAFPRHGRCLSGLQPYKNASLDDEILWHASCIAAQGGAARATETGYTFPGGAADGNYFLGANMPAGCHNTLVSKVKPSRLLVKDWKAAIDVEGVPLDVVYLDDVPTVGASAGRVKEHNHFESLGCPRPSN